MTLLRVLKTSQSTLSHTFVVDEVPTDAAGSVTVAIKRLDGTTVSSGTATHPGAPGLYTYVLPGGPTSPASATWQLDMLTVDWTGTVGGAAITVRDTVEVVGGFLFGLAEVRATHRSLASASAYPADVLAQKRIEVEQECERICRQAFVPRFYRETLSGKDTDRLATKHMMLRTLRAVTVSGVAWSPTDVSAVVVSEHGVLRRPGGATWPGGVGNVVIEYEHGWDQAPEEIRSAAMLRLRSRVGRPSSSIPDRAASYTTEDGGSYRLSTAGRQKTGIPDVDGDYERYTRQPRAVFA